MIRPLVALVLAAGMVSTAAAQPAWVAANQCVAEPPVEAACLRDPVVGASRHDLEQCACDLLATAGLGGCDDLRASEGRELTIDRKLATAIGAAKGPIYKQPTLLAAVGAIAAMRTATIANDPDIAAATGICRRLVDNFKRARGTTMREDLVCSIARAERTPQLARRWPWCGGCSKSPTSRALAFSMPTTNVRYPAMFDIAAAPLAGSYNAVQWACVSTREQQAELQFADAPIAVDMTRSLSEFATVASVWASPYVIDEIALGACTDVRLKTGPETRALRTGSKLSLANVRKHARGTSCDLDRVTFRAPSGKRVTIPLTGRSFRDALVPYVARAFAMKWSELRTFASEVGVRHLYAELVDKVRAEPLGTELDAMVLGVLTRRALVEAGLVVYDPLINAGHDSKFHVELSASATPPERVINETTPIADVNRAIQAIDHEPLIRERARVQIQGTSTDPFETLVRRQAQKWCAAEREATITFEFIEPAPATRLHAWSDGGEVTVVGNDKPWSLMVRQAGYFGFTASDPVPLRTLSVRVRSNNQACVHFVLEGRHVGDVGEAHDLEIERVTRPDDLASLDPFIGELDRAIGNCSLTALAKLAHLPLVVDYRRWGKTVRRTYKSARELARACHLGALPRPTPSIDVTTDGVTATQHFADRKNRVWWSYRVEQGRWRLTGARFEHDDP